MIVLAIGANVGDRLENFRKAIIQIKKIPNVLIKQISPLYYSTALLPQDAPKEWDKPYLNFAISIETTISPFELLPLIKNIEWSIGRKPEVRHWGPRILDIDILTWYDQIIQTELLTIPHQHLQDRPFALWPLADIAPLWKFPLAGENQGKTACEIVRKWGSRFDGNAPFQTKQILQRIDTPTLMGIINATDNSFSDGGKYLNSENALNQAVKLINDGAEIIDIGAESTAPNAKLLSPEDEWQRLEPIILSIKQHTNNFLMPPKVSIDTRHASTAEKALMIGVDFINDVSGLNDIAMLEVIKAYSVKSIFMHSLSLPASKDNIIPNNVDPVNYIHEWASKRLNELTKFGISPEKLIFDPGIGFGKNANQSLEIMQRVSEFKSLGVEILIGHSRKSCLSLFTDKPAAERDIETLAASVYLADQSVDYLRLHDVEICARYFKVMRATGFEDLSSKL